MPHEFLSDEQIARYARFPAEVSIGDLEQFFLLDAKALQEVAPKRLSTTKLGWALQWGTVRMLRGRGGLLQGLAVERRALIGRW